MFAESCGGDTGIADDVADAGYDDCVVLADGGAYHGCRDT